MPLSWEPPPDLIVANKLDLPGAEVRPGELGVSALSGLGLERLQEALVAELVRRFPEETEPLPLSEELLGCLTQLGGAADREAGEECGRELAGLVRICRLS